MQHTPGSEPPADNHQGAGGAHELLSLIHGVSTASRQLRRKLAEVAATCDLSDSELLVVWLCRGAGLVQVELAAAVGVSPAQMSGLAERLARRQLVALNRPARDRRRQVCRTTAAGEALLAKAAAPLAGLATALAERLAPHEQALLQSLCERLTSAASESPGELHDEQRVCQEAA